MLLSGCALLGYAASALPQNVEPKYTGLGGQNCAVMVWADRGIRTDYPSLQIESAAAIQAALQASKEEKLKDAKWPWPAASVLLFQREHPDIDATAITEVAPRISGVSRLIYIEIQNFGTRSEDSLQLFRGTVQASLKVVEVTNGQAKVAYEEQNIRAVFPKNAPEGVVNVDPYRIYRETVAVFATEVANRFITHEAEK